MERLRLLGPFVDELRDRIRSCPNPALAFGLGSWEGSRLLSRGRSSLAGALDPFGAGCFDAERPGIDLILGDASELVFPLARRVAMALARGRCVLLASSPHFPQAGSWIAEALGRFDLPPGLLACLHGDGRETFDALVEQLSDSTSPGPEGRPGSSGPRVEAMPWDPRLSDLDRAWVRPSGEFRTCGFPSSFLVDGDGDLDAQARLLLRASWGRSSTLGGQIPGGYSRVLCPESSFSAFTEALLDPLDRWLRDPGEHPEPPEHPEPRGGPTTGSAPEARASILEGPPLPWFDPSLLAFFEEALALGLDEGSTLIFGGGTWSSCGGRGSVPRRTRVPAIFTNVEFRHRLPRLVRPAPLLSLLRVPRGTDPAAWAREFEREAKRPSTDLLR